MLSGMRAPRIPEDERSRLGELCALGLLDSEADPIFDRITRLTSRVLGVPIALVSFIDADRQWFKSRQGLDVCETGRDISFCGHAILEDEIFVIEDATLDERFADNPLVAGEFGLRFYAGVPLAGPAGHRLGTLCVIDKRPRVMTAHDRANLSDLAGIVEAKIAQLSLGVTDQLTGLHNRRGLETAAAHLLAVADRNGEPVSIAYLDVNDLKKVNDTDGHSAGDELISATAALLRETFRGTDIVSRIGGDEFVVVMYGTPEELATRAVDRLQEAVNRTNRTSNATALSLSAGVASYTRGQGVEDLLATADAAMYRDKTRRKGAAT